MENIDFSKAPEGATHYTLLNNMPLWVDWVAGNYIRIWLGDFDAWLSISLANLMDEPLPIPPQPKIGEWWYCEATNNDGLKLNIPLLFDGNFWMDTELSATLTPKRLREYLPKVKPLYKMVKADD